MWNLFIVFRIQKNKSLHIILNNPTIKLCIWSFGKRRIYSSGNHGYHFLLSLFTTHPFLSHPARPPTSDHHPSSLSSITPPITTTSSGIHWPNHHHHHHHLKNRLEYLSLFHHHQRCTRWGVPEIWAILICSNQCLKTLNHFRLLWPLRHF